MRCAGGERREEEEMEKDCVRRWKRIVYGEAGVKFSDSFFMVLVGRKCDCWARLGLIHTECIHRQDVLAMVFASA